MERKRKAKKVSRDTMGRDVFNPIQAVITTETPIATQGEAREYTGSRRKVRATFNISEDCLNAVRDTVVALSLPPMRLTMSSFAEDAFWSHVECLRKKYNRGKPFPAYDGKVRTGRPIGS